MGLDLGFIGRTIGEAFGFGKKKDEQQPRPQPLPAQRPVAQPQRQQPGFNPGVEQFRAPAYQPTPKPSTVGQPIQSTSTSNPVNDVGQALFGGASKLANQGLGIIETAGSHAIGGIQQALGDKAGGQRTIEDTKRHINQDILSKGKGLFGSGGVYNSVDELHNASIGDVIRRAGGTGLQAAAETLPIGKGINIATKAAPFVQKVAQGAVQGALSGGVGNVGSQIVQKGTVDPLELAKNVGIGAAFGGSIPAVVGAPRAISNRVADIKAQPSFNPEAGFAQIPKKPIVTPKTAPQIVPQTVQTANPSFSDYTDTLLKNAGIDINQGLVKPNAFYTNPLTSGFNKAQQDVIERIDSARDAFTGKLQKGLESDNPLVSTATRLPQVAFKNFGQSDANRQILTARSSKIQAAGDVAKSVQRDFENAVNATGNPEATNRRIYQVLESPDYLQKVYGDPTKLTVGDLAPKEKVVMDKLIASNKIRNDINLETGQITPEQHAQFADGFHSPRLYDLSTEGSPMGTSRMVDNSASIKRKDITKISDAVTDNALKSPTLASSVRLETALRNKANMEALGQLSDAGLIRDSAPNKNYVKLEGKQYGEWSGKYIDSQIKSQIDGNDIFSSSLAQKTSELVGAYQDSPLGAIDRFQKKIKTVFAPATNLGNISSNILAFSGAANVNPATVAVRMSQAAKQLYKHGKSFDANVYRAEKAGLFSGDTGRQLVGKNQDVLKTLERSKNPIQKIESFYGKTDQAAALGIFNELKARGLTDEQAVRRTHKAVQDYNNVGRGINLLADSPVLGKPFARFTPELLRIAKNNALYNPIGTAAKVGGLAAGSAALSNAAGETDAERQARENAVGQTKLSGTGFINDMITGGKNKGDVSLNLPIGDASVNIARASGLNFPIEPGGDAAGALARQLSPLADFTRKTADGNTEIAPNQLISSMGLRPLADQLVNRDFMGRQITDPNNKIISEIGKGKSQYENADGTRQSPGQQEEIKNRLRTLGMNFLPLSSEADALYNAATNQKDYYGKVRSLPEAALRTIGLKTESNTKDVREKRVSTQKFYEGKDQQVKDFLTKNPEIADSYFKFNDSSRDRFTNKKSSALVTPEKWSIVKGDNTGKLFGQLKQEALDANKSDGKPIDPLFQLNDPKRVKDVLAIRSSAPGDNIEKEEILRATTDWYKPFEKAESDYYKASQDYFSRLPKSQQPAEPNDRVKAYSEIKYPEQSQLVQDYYKAKATGAQAGKDFFKSHADALSADFAKYKDDKLNVINKKREILGLDPIKQDTFNNVTFGYEDDEAKVAKELAYKGFGGGRGFGGRRGSGLGKSSYSYAVSANAGGQFKKPTVKKAKVQPISIQSAKTAKPKVSLKKNTA